MGLIPSPPGFIVAGRIRLRRKRGECVEITAVDEPTLRRIRGNDVSMIFQEPMTSLNPVFTVGDQIAEAIQLHRGRSRREAWGDAVDMLDRVGIADPAKRAREYPHQLSGGMRQRAMIAMALSCDPVLLIADEPTTALDVTIQAQILDLMRTLQRESEQRMSIVFITHNLGVVADMADRVAVMYGGRVVEEASVVDLFGAPRHPYTIGLLNSIPRGGDPGYRLNAIPGNVPDPRNLPEGCAFAPRCGLATTDCAREPPAFAQVGPGHAEPMHTMAGTVTPGRRTAAAGPGSGEVLPHPRRVAAEGGRTRQGRRPGHLRHPPRRGRRTRGRVRFGQDHGGPHHPSADRAHRRRGAVRRL